MRRLLVVIASLVVYAIGSVAYAANITVDITDGGFAPQVVTINAGDTITWVNNSSDEAIPSSDPHPVHTDYPELTASPINISSSYTTPLLTKVGTWGYHNHNNPSVTGTVVIVSSGATGGTTGSSSNVNATGACLDCTPPGVLNIVATPLDDSRVRITFRTDEPSFTIIHYGTTTSYGQATDWSTTTQQDYNITISGLLASTTYYYHIGAKDAVGNVDFTKYPNQTFTTLPAPSTATSTSDATTTAISTAAVEDDEVSSRVELRKRLCDISNGGTVLFTSLMHQGWRGREVEQLQLALALEGDVYPDGSITGYFGSATFQAVKNFQTKHYISPTGAVGPLTRGELNEHVSCVAIPERSEISTSTVVDALSSTTTKSTTMPSTLQGKLDAALAEIEELKKGLTAAFNEISQTNHIGQLANVTVSGVSGLTDADIPDNITVSGDQSLGNLSLSGKLTTAGGVTFADGSTQTSKGLEFLGSKILTAGSSSTGVLTIPARDELLIIIRIASYGGGPTGNGDIASLRFNGDSSNNYWSRHLHADVGVSGTDLWKDEQMPSTNLIRLAETDSRLSRNVIAQVNNLATKSKTVNIKNQTGSNDATLVAHINIGGGEWVNTTSQITQIEMLTATGGNMGTGSAFAVYGLNF